LEVGTDTKRLEILLRVIRVLSALIVIIPSSVGYADDGLAHTEEIVLATESAPGLTEAEASKLDPLEPLCAVWRTTCSGFIADITTAWGR
jgi:hypothetical protein